jgi:hypothetical protein
MINLQKIKLCNINSDPYRKLNKSVGCGLFTLDERQEKIKGKQKSIKKIIFRRHNIKKFNKINNFTTLQRYCDPKFFEQEFKKNGELVHDIVMEIEDIKHKKLDKTSEEDE